MRITTKVFYTYFSADRKHINIYNNTLFNILHRIAAAYRLDIRVSWSMEFGENPLRIYPHIDLDGLPGVYALFQNLGFVRRSYVP